MSGEAELDMVEVGGPYFEDFFTGQVFDTAPSVTLTDGAAAVHQSILGDRMRLPLDAHLSAAVTGRSSALAHPGLVCDIAIGQSTLATHHVKANLFYRGLRFHSFPHIGDTVHTRTEVVGLKANSVKPGRRATGLVTLRMVTVDQNGVIVLDFLRCAMIPFRETPSGVSTPQSSAPTESQPDTAWTIPTGWDLSAIPTSARRGADLRGIVFVSSADVVSSAPELARLTLNIAATHHDSRVNGGSRLVYGGHTIGIALSQATRAFPNLVTVLGWESCDHLAPVREGDTVVSRLEVESVLDAGSGAMFVGLRSLAEVVGDGPAVPVLDWRFTVLST